MPSATVRRTFLFTDIESSTRLWDQFPEAMFPALEQHDVLVQDCVVRAGGRIVKNTGDGFVAVFPSAGPAVEAAVAVQRALAAVDFGGVERLKVRIGVHSGDVLDAGGELHGWAINVAARLHALAHGGQIVVSGAAMTEAAFGASGPVDFVDLGMHRLRDVAEPLRIYTVVAEGLADRFSDVRDSEPVTSIPRSLTRFLGRSDELDRLRREILDHRLITLVGLAGVGKTRLAVESASGMVDRFTDGVVLCELAGAPPSQVGAVVAKALGVERRTLRSVEESAVEWLHDKALLLVLDNCEDAADAVAELALTISLQAPGCHMLATGRHPLGVPGEQIRQVRPLVADALTDDSVELFLDRARSAGAEVPDDADTRGLVREICRAVDGLPLAIELAASNATSLSLVDILDAVRTGELRLASRAGGRHGSVEDALDLTVERLDPALHQAFLRCSVLPGTFDRAAFAAIVGSGTERRSALELLQGLTYRSLLSAETRRDHSRFRLLEPVRIYADARIEPVERAEAQERFVRHYVEVAESASTALREADEARWVAQIELDFDNLRAAHAHALGTGDADSALRIVAALWDFAFMRMRSEIFDWGEAACAAAPADHPDLAKVLGIVALGGWLRDNPEKTEQFAAESLQLERERGWAPSLPVRLALLNSAEYAGATTDVRELMHEVSRLATESADPYWQTNVDVVRSLGMSFAGRSDAAIELANRAMARARDSANPSTMAWALFGRGVAYEPVDVAQAESLLDDSLARARSVENRWIGAMCTTRLASVWRRRGAVRDAMTLVLELLDTWERAGHRSHLWTATRQAALCLADCGDSETAVVLNGAASAARLALPLLPADTEDLAAVLGQIRRDAKGVEMDRWLQRSEVLDQAEAVRIARDRLERAIAG